MDIKSDSFFSKMFLLAGVWNLNIGLIGIFFTDFSIGLFFGPDAVTNDFVAMLMFRLFSIAVLMFGAGYYIVSRALMQNRGIVWLGLASKMILFVVFMLLFVIEKATPIAALAVTGDFLWSLLFIYFLYHTRKQI